MPNNSNPYPMSAPAPTPTGNILVAMKPGMKTSAAVKSLEGIGDMKVAVSTDYFKKDSPLNFATDDADSVYLKHLEVAVIRPRKGTNVSVLSTSLSNNDNVKSFRPEFYLYSYDHAQQKYQDWVRQGLKILADGVPNLPPNVIDTPENTVQLTASSDATWGIKAISADQSAFTGKGIKIAVLDTGFALDHPDFTGRSIISESFVPGEDVQDFQGHGTHCIGTAAGPTTTNDHPRYGVSMEADIFAGKVLSNQGFGEENWIWAGMEWAIDKGCEVISMSLGRATQPGEQPDEIYEHIGRRALENGSLIIAAAGNESARQFNHIAPVGNPANSPSIMAVGAVNNTMNVSDFSCGGINGNDGEVNICAPGEDVFSSFPLPRRHRRLRGTSMAAPHCGRRCRHASAVGSEFSRPSTMGCSSEKRERHWTSDARWRSRIGSSADNGELIGT